MRAPSFATKVGTTTDARPGHDVIVISEPDVGATLRTKGRLYLVCEVSPQSAGAGEIARDVADVARQEYYYDLSAGIEVSLRKALRQANRRATQRLKDHRGRGIALHCVCAVIVGNEVYAAKVGAAHVFLVRRARLFLPGDDPGELADFVHRTTTREAKSLGSEADVLPAVWRQVLDAGDTLILAGPSLVEGLGAEALKDAAVTLHPRAAAQHVHERFVAEGAAGSDAALFVEVGQAAGAASRVAPREPSATPPPEVAIADTIRSGVDRVWRRRPRVGEAVRAAASPAGAVVSKGVAVGIELLPRRSTVLPRLPDTARERSRRNQRTTTLLAFALLLLAAGVGAIAYRDYASSRVGSEYQAAVVRIEEDIAGARRLADRRPPDPDGARERLARAQATIASIESSPVADTQQIAGLRLEIVALEDRLSNVIVDLERLAPGARPVQLAATANGLYLADPGTGRLWRITGDPPATSAVLQRGKDDIAAPVAVTAQGDVLLLVDDARRIWRTDGVFGGANVTPRDNGRWKSVNQVVTFANNIYVLDAASGQLWKHEPDRAGAYTTPAVPFLATALAPDTARSVAVDGDVWVVTTAGEILRHRRSPTQTTAARLEFAPRWSGEAVRATAIQALESQGFIYLLDGPGKRVVQMARDGREIARFVLPSALSEASAFFVSEGQQVVYSVHGSRVAVTSIAR